MDEAADKIFEMVKSKINEPKKKRRKRVYTEKQMQVIVNGLLPYLAQFFYIYKIGTSPRKVPLKQKKLYI